MKHHRINTSFISLEELRMEKIRLKAFCSYQEKMIVYKVDYLIDHYPKILGDTMLPYDGSKKFEIINLLDSVNDFIANLLPGIFKDRQFPGFLLRILEILMIRMFAKKN